MEAQLSEHRLQHNFERSLAHAVLQAGKILSTNSPANSGREVVVELKADGSPVTSFDKLSSARILQELRAIDPKGHLVSEEDLPTTPISHKSSWYVDPLDGTKQFIKGENIYAIFVGRRQQDRFTYGLMYYPALGIFVRGGEGRASGFVSTNGYFEQVKEHKGDGQFIASRQQDYSGPGRIDFEFPTRNLPIVSVFAGVAEAAVAKFPKGVSLWDISATLAIARSRKLSVTDLNGAPIQVNDMRMVSTGLLVCKPERRDEVLGRLRDAQ